MNRPEYFIGVDIASATFTASVLTAPGELVMLGETIPNTPEGFTGFVSGLEAQRIAKGFSLRAFASSLRTLRLRAFPLKINLVKHWVKRQNKKG